MTLRAKVIGCGHYLPEKIVTNHDLASIVETDDAWIQERTGIAQRHIAAEGEFTSDLAANALKNALAHAGILAADVDLILLATATPDKTFPSAATITQAKAGCVNAAAMDVNAACSGFVYGMHLAHSLIRTGAARTIAVIGAETMSRVVDWQDRRTCILFGDGAGAVILRAEDNNSPDASGILYSEIFSDGSFAPILSTDGGISSTQTAGVLSMDGQEVFRHAVSKMSQTALHSLQQSGIDAQAIDWVVPHQANYRILSAVAKKLGIAEDTLISTVKTHANTSAASIPLALSESVHAGKIISKNYVMCPALGAGLTWGTCIIRW
jgi:3-oxoacyl-[acyl-carrier-protein] synthase-3